MVLKRQFLRVTLRKKKNAHDKLRLAYTLKIDLRLFFRSSARDISERLVVAFNKPCPSLEVENSTISKRRFPRTIVLHLSFEGEVWTVRRVWPRTRWSLNLKPSLLLSLARPFARSPQPAVRFFVGRGSHYIVVNIVTTPLYLRARAPGRATG